MGKKAVSVLPSTEKILAEMGEQIKLARLRRQLSTELVAERAGISRATLWNVEKGSPSVAIGIYAAVLHLSLIHISLLLLWHWLLLLYSLECPNTYIFLGCLCHT